MPARKPRRLKALTGTLQACRDRPELELPQIDGVPEAPDFLDIVAAKEFDRAAALLTAAGVLSEGDLGLLTAYAAAWGNLVKLWLAGMNPKPAELTAFRQVATELGLSPRARASLPQPKRGAGNGNKFAGIGRRPRGDAS